MNKTVKYCLLVMLMFVSISILSFNIAYATDENVTDLTESDSEDNVNDSDKEAELFEILENDNTVVLTQEPNTTIINESTVNVTSTASDNVTYLESTGPEVKISGIAKIGEVEYSTLDEAVAEAKDGDTIIILGDCETEGLNLSKNITIEGVTGDEKITFTKYGIALWGKTLTFRNVNVIMSEIGSTPYTAEWNWMTICASKNAVLNLENASLTMDGANTGNKHAIYFCSNNKLNLTNSNLTIKNYQQDALEWDGGNGGYNVNLINSTYISDNNRSGFTGTFYATIDNSIVKVINSTGNGSNGTYYTIKNNSNVLFDGNRNWGISAWRIDMTNNSTLTATNNGYSGVWTRVLNVDSTCTLDVEENGRKATGFTTNAGIFFQGNGTYKSLIEKGANVIIKNNAGSGIYTAQGVCNLTILSGIITNNGTGSINATNGKGATYGGGIYNIGTIVLGEEVVVYNNHADTAGDDIYSTKLITFGNVGTDWYLDGMPDCNGATDKINGYYDDSEGTRWNAHNKDLLHYELVNTGTIEGKIAVKAAHDLIVKDIDVTFKVENGTWEDGTTEDKTVTYHVVELLEEVTLDDGTNEVRTVKYAVTLNEDGSVKEILADDVKLSEKDVPTNMKPNEGYENGNWNKNDYTLETTDENGEVVYNPNTVDYLKVEESPYVYIYNFEKEETTTDTSVVNADSTTVEVNTNLRATIANPKTGSKDEIYIVLFIIAIIAGVVVSVKKSRV